MKIAFFSALSFGAMGSPGTYKFIEACNHYYDLLVFAPLSQQQTVYKTNFIPIIPVNYLLSKSSIRNIVDCLMYFNPDIIYIVNFYGWFSLLTALKKEFPDKKYILDLKSPLLEEEREKREEIQKNGNQYFPQLDAIVTVSKHNVPTWIPNSTINPLVYPLGIDSSLFEERPARHREKCLKFVYVGVLNRKRHLKLLIEIFSKFVLKTKEKVTLDFYGSGPDQNRLEQTVYSLSMDEHIKFLGLKPQKELMSLLPTYDAGIAWVPNDLYDTSPSLKAIEYMAAGLPILASSTTAHRQLEKEGCSIDYFENTMSSLVDALLNVYDYGFSHQRLKQNSKTVQAYDYHRIIHDYFNDFFWSLTHTQFSKRNEQASPDLKNIGEKKESKTNRTGLKMVLFFKPSLLSVRQIANRLNRFIIEMVSRDHLLYLLFPADETPPFNPSEKSIFLPYQSFQIVKDQVQKLTPDLLMIAPDNSEQFKYASLAHETDIPLVILDLCSSHHAVDGKGETGRSKHFDRARAIWKNEILLPFAALKLTVEKTDKQYLSSDLQKKIVAFPQIVFQDEGAKDVELNCPNEIKRGSSTDIPEWFPISNLDLQNREDLTEKIFDFIEMNLLNASEIEKQNPGLVPDEQVKHDPEIALHIRRMRKKIIKDTTGWLEN